ncbi:MAG: hypothetical protein K0U45_05055 [Alphaproteobacteria bacterium]|nr:hypothetical protein [Alphaproteobacteria bacterium]
MTRDEIKQEIMERLFEMRDDGKENAEWRVDDCIESFTARNIARGRVQSAIDGLSRR